MRNKFLVFLCGLSLFSAFPVFAESDAEKAQTLVDRATESAKVFTDDPNMDYLHKNLGNAEGILIVPKMTKGAFIVGGSGGKGVLLKRMRDNVWSYPAFYNLSSGSIGIQIGGEVSQLVLMVMTKGGMDGLLASSFKLGADASVAAGPVGVGAKGQAADIMAFSRTKGAFVGVSLEGTVVKVNSDYNSAYYGRTVRASDIFITQSVKNPHADSLRDAIAKLVTVGSGG